MRVVPMYHPAAVFHNPNLQRTVVKDFENFPEIKRTVQETHYFISESLYLQGDAAIDTETEIESGDMKCLAGSGEEGEAWSIIDTQNLVLGEGRSIFHNAKFDLRVLERYGIRIPQGKYVDTMIAASSLGYPQVGLHRLARQVLGMELRHWGDARDLKDLMLICCSHADATRRLWVEFEPRLPEFYWNIDLPLVEVLMRMENRGVQIDFEAVKERQGELEKEISKLEFPFNPKSTPQVRRYLYEDENGPLLTPTKTTDKGEPSTDASVLEALDDPMAKSLLRFRRLGKEKSTYVDDYVERVDSLGRIHPDYIQTRQPSRDLSKDEGTRTGRLSCARPNLQNPTKRSGGSVRRFFVAKDGHLFVKVDYDQIELRVIAALSGDPTMLRVYKEGGDIHQETADATGLPRKREYAGASGGTAKELNFLMTFGGTEYRIEKEWGWSVKRGREIIDGFFRKYPGVKSYMDRVGEEARETKKVSNYFGRGRTLDEFYSPDRWVQQKGLREAINTPVQGTAADIVKKGMVALGAEAPMVLQVHDEIIFEVPEGEAREYGEYVREVLGNVIKINGVTFPVEIDYGKNWEEME